MCVGVLHFLKPKIFSSIAVHRAEEQPEQKLHTFFDKSLVGWLTRIQDGDVCCDPSFASTSVSEFLLRKIPPEVLKSVRIRVVIVGKTVRKCFLFPE